MRDNYVRDIVGGNGRHALGFVYICLVFHSSVSCSCFIFSHGVSSLLCDYFIVSSLLVLSVNC